MRRFSRLGRLFGVFGRQLAGALIGGGVGLGVQAATGVPGWGLVGLCLGIASVSMWLGIRDPRR